VAWLVDLQRTAYPHKWSPVNYSSSAKQGKFAGQRPTFHHSAATNRKVVKVNDMQMLNENRWNTVEIKHRNLKMFTSTDERIQEDGIPAESTARSQMQIT